MTNNPENPSAFACATGTPEGGHLQEGMTLRDYFAGKALSGLLTNSDTIEAFKVIGCEPDIYPQKLSEVSYELADAMLKQRIKGE